MVASDDRSLAGQKEKLFFTCSKAEQRKVGTTVFIGPCMAIIFCTLLTYRDLVVKVADAASGEGEPSDKVCVLQLVLNLTCGSIFLFLCREMRELKD